MVQYFADIFHSVNSALKGMGVTIKHIVRKPVTLQYPDERWVLPDRFRGFVHNDIIRCNACMGCAKACPVSCIYIETDGKGKDRYMTRWAVDFNKCIWCGLCTDPCPTEAVTMSHDYDHSLYFRENLVYEFVPATEPVPCHKEKRLAMGYYVEEKAKPAAESSSSAKKPEAKKPEAAKPDAATPAAAKPETEKPAPETPATEEAESPAEPLPAGNPERSSSDAGPATEKGEPAAGEDKALPPDPEKDDKGVSP